MQKDKKKKRKRKRKFYEFKRKYFNTLQFILNIKSIIVKY